jgi:hypothetical protein
MYRVIRMFNGGQRQDIDHFNTLSEAYKWLLPTNTVQEQERWHIKLLPAIRRDFEEYRFVTVTMGFNEMLNLQECTLYIQIVEDFQSNHPKF